MASTPAHKISRSFDPIEGMRSIPGRSSACSKFFRSIYQRRVRQKLSTLEYAQDRFHFPPSPEGPFIRALLASGDKAIIAQVRRTGGQEFRSTGVQVASRKPRM